MQYWGEWHRRARECVQRRHVRTRPRASHVLVRGPIRISTSGSFRTRLLKQHSCPEQIAACTQPSNHPTIQPSNHPTISGPLSRARTPPCSIYADVGLITMLNANASDRFNVQVLLLLRRSQPASWLSSRPVQQHAWQRECVFVLWRQF